MAAALLLALVVTSAVAGAPVDDGVIRLRPSAAATEPGTGSELDAATSTLGGPRRGFDYEAFESRLESLWFQRKTLLADGRDEDAKRQAQLIREFSAEEGVGRLEHLSGALLAEARRSLEQGHHARSLDALQLAEALDPDRPEIHLARADVYQRSGRGRMAAAGEFLVGARKSVLAAVSDLSLLHRVALLLVFAWAGGVVVFSVLMLLRYHVPFRHEIEERTEGRLGEAGARAAGWAVLLAPVLTWFGAGWAPLYWIAGTFRFMGGAERVAGAVLLGGTLLLVPGYQVAVRTYGLAADPELRTTLAAANGDYDPDRIVKLRELVQAHPDDPSYRFLLAGLYAKGRYLEEALAEYGAALELDPGLEQAHVNTGNVFYSTGQYREAVAWYRRALEIEPRSLLALFNMHLAQSEAFRFQEAEQTLEQAKAIDARRLADLFVEASREERPRVIDASLETASVWRAALGGSGIDAAGVLPNGLHPAGVGALIALFGCAAGLAWNRFQPPARRCIRCGRPFCHLCKTGREGHEYCSQCYHLYVLGDGLAPETKHRKLFDVERHARHVRAARGLASVLLPGSSQLLRGRALAGLILLMGWIAALAALQPAVLVPFERLSGVDLRLGLVHSGAVPPLYGINVLAIFGACMASLVWLAANIGRPSRREV